MIPLSHLARTTFAIAIALFLSNCSNEEIKYFRKLKLNGKLEYEGIYAIHESQVKDTRCYKLYYDEGKIQRIEFLNRGRLEIGEEGFAKQIYAYQGSFLLISLENEYGFRILQEDSYDYERWHVNEKGEYDRVDFLDRKFHPVQNGNIAFIKLTSDEKGRRKQSTFYNWDGQVTKNSLGVYGIQRTFDDQNNVVEMMYLNQNGEAMSATSGVAYVTSAFDMQDNEIERKHFDLRREPLNAVDGMATTRWKYDLYGYRIETRYFDRFDNLINATQGVAINTYTYNKSGDLISREYYDSINQPVYFDGYAKLTWFYNKYGLCTKQFFFKKTETDSVYSEYSLKFFYDQRYHLVQQLRFDSGMKLKEEYGIAIHRIGYDGAHNMVSYQTFNAKDEPTPFEKAIARVVWNYNEWGEKIETRYYDVNGDLTGGEQHEAINRFVYNECGYITERSFYDSLERPINYNGAATIKYLYSDDGLYLNEVKYDQDGNQVKEPVENFDI